MNERIHSVLDGDLPRRLLTAPEASELVEFQSVIGAAEDWASAAPVPSLSARVLSALPEQPATTRPTASARAAFILGAWKWLWTPRSLVLRPAAALVPAFALVLAIAVGGVPGAAPEAGGLAAVAAPAIYVQFRLDAPGAETVAVAGSFTGWRPEHEMREAAPGVWTVRVPLDPGIHDYVFIVDGRRWVPDPAGHLVDDGFGGANSRLYLTAPRQGAA
ncbi:MAG: glycogen-binding domain-containing protein [Gemmatimonadetes bacterium]|nr:glycogen-binding domain-containing protein [Gemmatimonadota bacterium]